MNSLAARLRDHATFHELFLAQCGDEEQRQWADDLREAARIVDAAQNGVGDAEIARLRAELDFVRDVADEAELNREGIKHAHAEIKRLKARLET